MDDSMLQLRAGSVDFTAFSYVPEIDALTGLPLVTHEDDPHKLKLLANHIRAQAGGQPAAVPPASHNRQASRGQRRAAADIAKQPGTASDAGSGWDDGLLISKARILEAAATGHRLCHIPALLSSSGGQHRCWVSS